jgi:hypothetical protein
MEVNIDFDDASKEWNKNKKKTTNGMYKYICTAETKSGNPCNNSPILDSNFCYIHSKKRKLHQSN